MQIIRLLLIFLICFSTSILGQGTKNDSLINGELKITFPSVYFKHKSIDYASMPYTVDSCFKHIAASFNENIVSLIIWRDSLETEQLSSKRIKKLKSELKKYLKKNEIEIYSMDMEQKISRHTINATTDSTKINYLLSLNSVFDISKTRLPFKTKESHMLRPSIFCASCWKNGFHLNKRGREARKMARKNKQKEKPPEKRKKRKRLIWTGWKTGFHWSTAG